MRHSDSATEPSVYFVEGSHQRGPILGRPVEVEFSLPDARRPNIEEHDASLRVVESRSIDATQLFAVTIPIALCLSHAVEQPLAT